MALIVKHNQKIIAYSHEGKVRGRLCNKCYSMKRIDAFHDNPRGFEGKHSTCKTCQGVYSKENQKKNEYIHSKLYNYRQKALENGLPSVNSIEIMEKAKDEQRGECVLTGSKDNLSTDHFTPLKWGTGMGDTYENIIYMDRWLNTSKGNRNPFSWIKNQPKEIQDRFYYILVPMLADRNGMTPREFKEYVNECYAEYEANKDYKEV
ncbi:hypothetical protein [Virgibacillus siamensis]|uniref:hypothetical protein n=1 Tax=Virgibacillus siamensis TaxID=480071 RepID=UPI0009855CC1|nr:hypothetical protein [Virgibacillus siamensis]